MNHPTRDQWVSCLYGELRAGERAGAIAHLRACRDCKGLVEEWQAIGKDLEAWQDVVQESLLRAFARVFTKRQDYQPKSRLSTWLWRIAMKLWYEQLLQRRRGQKPLLDILGRETSGVVAALAELEIAPGGSVAARQQGEMIRRALMLLSALDRTILVLRHYENLKFRQIAELVGLPEATVKSRMLEALAQMSRLLKLPPPAATVQNLKKTQSGKRKFDDVNQPCSGVLGGVARPVRSRVFSPQPMGQRNQRGVGYMQNPADLA